jgi:predicted DNA-binding ribbon-helix-helix protein
MEIAGARHVTLSDLVGTIDSERRHGNLSSAIRLFVLDFYRGQFTDAKPTKYERAINHKTGAFAQLT